LVDLQRTVCPHKWSPVSCRSSAGQGSLPTKYRRSTTVLRNQPTALHSASSRPENGDKRYIRMSRRCDESLIIYYLLHLVALSLRLSDAGSGNEAQCTMFTLQVCCRLCPICPVTRVGKYRDIFENIKNIKNIKKSDFFLSIFSIYMERLHIHC